MCRVQLINACRNLEKAVFKSLQNHGQQIHKKHVRNVSNLDDKKIVGYMYDLSIIALHPEYYHFLKK